jgi:glycosyltransferase involved in cell wall biosynthesis
LTRSISIVIPAYNEEKRLPATLVKVREYLASARWDFAEVLVVDDGSRDGTVKVAEQAGVRVLRNPGNRGKGYTVKHGMLEARGDWVLYTDADLSAPIGVGV